MNGSILDLLGNDRRGRPGGAVGIYEELAELLTRHDPCARAEHLGFVIHDGKARLKFFGRLYDVGRTGVDLVEGPGDTPYHRGLMVAYALSSGFGERSGLFVPLACLAGPVAASVSFQNDRLEKPLAEMMEKDRAGLSVKLDDAGWEKLPTEEEDVETREKALFPKIAARLILREGDEEFPPEARFHYDRTAVNFLEFEFLAVLASLAVREIC